MRQNNLRKLGKFGLIAFLSLVGLVLIVPLFINPKALEGFNSIREMAGSSSRFVTIPFEGTDGIDLHYVEAGGNKENAPVFILLHGSMYNLHSWDSVLDYFATRGKTYAYDQIPYGLSEKLLNQEWIGPNPYSQDAAVKQLLSFIDAIEGGSDIFLVGSSYGGSLAVLTARKSPEKIRGLILVDAAVFVDESIPTWLLNSPQMTRLGPLMAKTLGMNMKFYKSCYADETFFSLEKQKKAMIMTEIENWNFALWEYLKAWGEDSLNFEEIIPQIDSPALVISGREDRIVPVEQSIKLDQLLKKSEIAIINASGHMPQEETPEDFIAIVEEWLKKQL